MIPVLADSNSCRDPLFLHAVQDRDGPNDDPGDPWPLDLIDECGPPHHAIKRASGAVSRAECPPAVSASPYAEGSHCMPCSPCRGVCRGAIPGGFSLKD